MVSSRSGLVERSATGAPVQAPREAHVFHRLGGRSAQEPRPAVSPTSLRILVRPARFAPGILRRRKVVIVVAIKAVADAALQGLELVEHVDAWSSAVCPSCPTFRPVGRTSMGVSNHRSGACAPSPCRTRAALATSLADLVASLRSGKRPLTPPGSCRPWRAENVAHRARPEARAPAAWPATVFPEGTSRTGRCRGRRRAAPPCAPSNRMRLPARRCFVEQPPGGVDVGQLPSGRRWRVPS